MRNQKGEVVMGVMVVMMVFGMSCMHGEHKDHGDRKDPVKDEQKHEHDGMGPKHMNHDHGDPAENATESGTVETK